MATVNNNCNKCKACADKRQGHKQQLQRNEKILDWTNEVAGAAQQLAQSTEMGQFAGGEW